MEYGRKEPDKKEKMARYKVSCRNFCNYYVKCQKLKDKMTYMTESDKESFSGQFGQIVAALEEVKNLFTKAKEDMGFDDGFKFIEGEYAFQGFEVNKGRVRGDYSEAIRWAAFNAKNEDNNLKFELAQLILQGAAMEGVKSYAS